MNRDSSVDILYTFFSLPSPNLFMWRPAVHHSWLSRNLFHSSRRFVSTDPNLTLFSGPTCSLCDVSSSSHAYRVTANVLKREKDAKSILNDVRKEVINTIVPSLPKLRYD